MRALAYLHKAVLFNGVVVKVIEVLPYFSNGVLLNVHIGMLTDKEEVLYKQVAPNHKFKVVKSNSLIEAAYKNYVKENFRTALRHTFTVGSDPEIFVTDEKETVIPAYKFLGSKQTPNIGDAAAYGSNRIYWDGFQAEFETSAQGCLSWQVDSVQVGLRSLLKLAKKHNPNARLCEQSTKDIDIQDLMTAEDQHVAFGCMPSYNVYGHAGVAAHGREVPFRSAGGHIHFGIGPRSKKVTADIVKALDAILGVACVSLYAGYDNPLRRTMYGLAGEYRLPAHGLEYRVLSNAWLIHPLIMHMTFDLARKVLRMGEQGLMYMWNATEEETIKCINTCDVTLAREILTRNKDIFLRILDAANMTQDAYDIFMKGLDCIVANPKDIASNWNCEKAWQTHSDGKGKSFRFAIDHIRTGRKVG